MSYYDDDERITFDDAARHVERYIREYGDRRNRVTCKQVAEAYDIAARQHNLIRLNEELDARLETTRSAGGKATQYRIP